MDRTISPGPESMESEEIVARRDASREHPTRGEASPCAGIELEHARLKTVIRGLHDALLLEDRRRRVVVANQSFCDLFEIPVPPEAMVGVDCARAAEGSKHAFADPAYFVRRVENILERREPVYDEIIAMADGRTVSRDYIPVFFDDEYRGHLWKYTDVTRRYDYERELERHNRLLEALHRIQSSFIARQASGHILKELLVDIVESIDASLGFIGEVHTAADESIYYEITGIHRRCPREEWHDELVGLRFGEDSESCIATALRRGERILREASESCASDLELLEHQALAVLPMVSQGGRVMGMVGLVYDRASFDESSIDFVGPLVAAGGNMLQARRQIARHREALRELERHEARHRAILDSSMDAVVAVDSDGAIVRWSRSAEEMFGRTSHEAMGRSLEELLVAPQDRSLYRERIERVAGRTSSDSRIDPRERFELETLHRDGTRFCCELSIHAIDIGEGLELTIFARDTTDARAARRQLERARRVAEQASEAKSEFLAMMSHEMRTPLNAIMGSTELLTDTRLDAEQRDLTQMMRTSASSLLYLISDLLDLSKIEAGHFEIEREAFELRQTVDEVLDLFRLRAEESDISLRSFIDTSLPETLLGDPNRIRQILVNLIGNALKFTEEGRVHLTVEQRETHERSVELRFSVEDTGCGIPDDQLERVFERFQQVDGSTRRVAGGTGLGLAISRALAELMGGAITVESELGRGSTFSLDLPLERSHEDAPKTLELNFSEVVEPDRYRVLVVEDRAENRLVIGGFLERGGFEVVEASDGAQGVELAIAEEFDAILMDIEMPRLDGFDATRRIREHERRVGRAPVVILAATAHAISGYREKCLAAGMDGHISKPIDRSLLVRRLHYILSRRRNIMIIDDDPVIRRVTAKMLSSRFEDIHLAASADEALAVIEEHPVELALIDWEMPGADGAATLAMLREATPPGELVAIALSGHSGASFRERCAAAGFEDCLTKPVERQALLATLSRHLDRLPGAS